MQKGKPSEELLAVIKGEYMRDEGSIEVLSERHGISRNALAKICTAQGWKKEKALRQQRRREQLAFRANKAKADRGFKTEIIADKILRAVSEMLNDGTVFLTPRDYKEITGVLKDLRDLSGEKALRDKEEQLARIEKMKREAQAGTVDLKNCGVLILPEIKEDDEGES